MNGIEDQTEAETVASEPRGAQVPCISMFGFDRLNNADELAIWREQTGCYDRGFPTEYPCLAWQAIAGDETPYAIFYTEADIERLLEAIRRPIFRKPNAPAEARCKASPPAGCSTGGKT